MKTDGTPNTLQERATKVPANESTEKSTMEAVLFRLEPSAEHTKKVIQRRLDAATEQLGQPQGSLVRITDEAYQAINEATGASVGLALDLLNMLLPSARQLKQEHPYIITKERVDALGLTREALEGNYDHPLKGAAVVHVKPRYEL